MITPARIQVAEYLATSYHPDREYIDRTVEERHFGEYDHTNLQSALLAWFRFCQREWNIRAMAGFETVPGHDSLTLNFFDELKRRVPVGGK
jgi:hypothetical protein